MPPKRKKPKVANTPHAFALTTHENILEAAKVCGDTSVLEKLYPQVFKSPAGKRVLITKKVVAENNAAIGRIKKIKKSKEITLTLDTKTAQVLDTVTRWIGGSPSGPRGAMDKIGGMLEAQGVKHYRKGISNAIHFGDAWESVGKAVTTEEDK